MGFDFPWHLFAYNLHVANGALQMASYRVLKKDKLRGRGAILLPYVKPVEFRFAADTRTAVQTIGISLPVSKIEQLGLQPLPWGALDEDISADKLTQIIIPEAVNNSRQTLDARIKIRNGLLHFPVKVHSGRVNRNGKYAIAPAELMGIIRTSQQREISYDRNLHDFVLKRSGFRGFRLYAHTIDDIIPLVKQLRSEGVEVNAQVEEIERIRVLDRGLTRIFWLVAIVGILGGVAALIASLYAAVERKKRELSILRVIGLSRFDLFRFPVYQGMTISALGVVLAIFAFWGLAAVINRVFAEDLDFGQRLCQLPGHYLVIAFALTVLTALLSSLLAAWKSTLIEPAEGMREE